VIVTGCICGGVSLSFLFGRQSTITVNKLILLWITCHGNIGQQLTEHAQHQQGVVVLFQVCFPQLNKYLAWGVPYVAEQLDLSVLVCRSVWT
jgi:hypothetical protein